MEGGSKKPDKLGMEVELSEPLLSGSDPPPSGQLLDEDARDDGPPPLERIPTGGAPVVLFSSLVGTQLVRARPFSTRHDGLLRSSV